MLHQQDQEQLSSVITNEMHACRTCMQSVYEHAEQDRTYQGLPVSSAQTNSREYRQMSRYLRERGLKHQLIAAFNAMTGDPDSHEGLYRGNVYQALTAEWHLTAWSRFAEDASLLS